MTLKRNIKYIVMLFVIKVLVLMFFPVAFVFLMFLESLGYLEGLRDLLGYLGYRRRFAPLLIASGVIISCSIATIFAFYLFAFDTERRVWRNALFTAISSGLIVIILLFGLSMRIISMQEVLLGLSYYILLMVIGVAIGRWVYKKNNR